MHLSQCFVKSVRLAEALIFKTLMGNKNLLHGINFELFEFCRKRCKDFKSQSVDDNWNLILKMKFSFVTSVKSFSDQDQPGYIWNSKGGIWNFKSRKQTSISLHQRVLDLFDTPFFCYGYICTILLTKSTAQEHIN